MIIGRMDEKPVALVSNGDAPFCWKFGDEIVRTPGEAMERIVKAAGNSGLPASRMIDRKKVREAQNALIRKQREQLAEAYRQRVSEMENDPRCPPELLAVERVEQRRAMDSLKEV